MKDTLKQIKLGKGLGDLQFGMSRTEVKALLGDPTEIDQNPFDDEAGAQTESWHYDQLKLSLSFEEAFGWEMDTIAVTDAAYLLDGKSLIGKSLGDVKAVLEKMDINDLELEDHNDHDIPNNKLLTSASQLINFWFDNEVLVEIQWGPDEG